MTDLNSLPTAAQHGDDLEHLYVPHASHEELAETVNELLSLLGLSAYHNLTQEDKHGGIWITLVKKSP